MALLYGGDTTEARRKAIEDRITPARLVQAFDDDGDGVVAGADLVKLETTMADADDIVTGILLQKGFTVDQLEHVKLDRQVVRSWVNIASQLIGERRVEWLDDSGLGVFDAFGVRGRAELGKLARGDLRSVAEPAGAGINTTIAGNIEPREMFYAPNPDDPLDRGPGGF